MYQNYATKKAVRFIAEILAPEVNGLMSALRCRLGLKRGRGWGANYLAKGRQKGVISLVSAALASIPLAAAQMLEKHFSHRSERSSQSPSAVTDSGWNVDANSPASSWWESSRRCHFESLRSYASVAATAGVPAITCRSLARPTNGEATVRSASVRQLPRVSAKSPGRNFEPSASASRSSRSTWNERGSAVRAVFASTATMSLCRRVRAPAALRQPKRWSPNLSDKGLGF